MASSTKKYLDQVKFEVTGGQKWSSFLKIGLYSQKIAIISITIIGSRIVRQPNDSLDPRYRSVPSDWRSA